MTNKNFNSRAPRTVSFDGFGGINTEAHQNHQLADLVFNFRIREDGALEKRCGSRCLFHLNQSIRALWSGHLHGQFETYFLAGNTVYTADLERKNITSIGTVTSSRGDGNFFCLQGHLYLADGGKNVYLIESDSVTTALGYVPLIGKDWDNIVMGEPHEPINLLNRHARISYLVGDSPSIFVKVPKPLASVERFVLNGTPLSEDQYEINNGLCAIEVLGLQKGDRIELCVTFEEESPLLPLFCSMKDSVFFCAGEKSRTFFFGKEGSDMMFCSKYVSPESLTQSQLSYDSDPLYLPEGYEFRVGDGSFPIRGAIRHQDSLLIFTDKETWVANMDSEDTDRMMTSPVHAEIGCVASHGCVLCPNDPITISHHGLYRWSRKSDQTQLDAKRISSVLDHRLSPEDLRNSTLFYDALHDELLLNVKTLEEIWIVSPERGDWYCFTGLVADQLFDADGRLGFVCDSRIFVMDPDMTRDIDHLNRVRNIIATYETASLDFDSAKPKNLSHLRLVGDLGAGEITLELISDETKRVSCTLKDSKQRTHATFQKRLRSGRFQNAKLCITSSDFSHVVIHSLTLVAH